MEIQNFVQCKLVNLQNVYQIVGNMKMLINHQTNAQVGMMGATPACLDLIFSNINHQSLG